MGELIDRLAHWQLGLLTPAEIDRKAVADAIADARAHIAALEAQLAERVRVKPLVWKELPGNQHCNIAFTADTIGGSFVIEERAGDTFDLWRMGQEIARRFGTLDEAKAAAQDWHNNAVAEVLEATPPRAEGERPMVDREAIAKLVYEAMSWAADCGPDQATGTVPPWVEGGNSLGQDEARKTADAILSALQHNTERVRVKPLAWNECRALYGGRKLVATDCFGREYARLDLKGQPDDFISDFKARVQEAYNTAILSALEATPRADGDGGDGSSSMGPSF